MKSEINVEAMILKDAVDRLWQSRHFYRTSPEGSYSEGFVPSTREMPAHEYITKGRSWPRASDYCTRAHCKFLVNKAMMGVDAPIDAGVSVAWAILGRHGILRDVTKHRGLWYVASFQAPWEPRFRWVADLIADPAAESSVKHMTLPQINEMLFAGVHP